MTHPVATYRLQLRQGMDFDRAVTVLPHIAGLGVSHLYLSPIFTATTGSTHGYDVANPAEIDPALGGRAGFERLARAAQGHGLDIILDLVPNHTVLSVENPWLHDALMHGANSAYAQHFDVDWQTGLILPILPDPLDDMLARDAFRVEDQRLTWEGGWLPLAPGSASDDISDVFRQQHWHLRHWQTERKRLTHRRFFNITDLIGMRVELPHVFDDMTALPLDLLRAGLAQGLRIDHIDGLADPEGYVHRLRGVVGPNVPIWVEKILTGPEDLPDWPITGTTGYEASDHITRLLMDADGMQRLDAIWRTATGAVGDYEDACQTARHEILSGDLGAELRELVTLAQAAMEEKGRHVAPDALREALRALLVAFPRYRSYIADDGPDYMDRALMEASHQAATAGLRDTETLDALRDMLMRASTPAAQDLVRRFQQVTGAVVAKAQEDTAFYRHTRCLAEAEVGSEPDAPMVTPDQFEDWCSTRLARWPEAMTLGSSHDTKRAEDARARLIAITHCPEAMQTLWDRSLHIDGADQVPAGLRWYAVQSALALWQPERDDLEDRLAAHMEKAMREAKQVTTWQAPDAQAEGAAQRFACAVLAQWRTAPETELLDIVARAETISLTQLALRCLMPGVPDVYQGTEFRSFHLTDPDNRAPLDLSQSPSDFGTRKTQLLRDLLALRRTCPEVMARGAVELQVTDGLTHLTRQLGATTVTLTFCRNGTCPPQVTRTAGAAKAEKQVHTA
ncbi:malto-oligosyltrehalose synthase [Sagittula sp. NFXS13]|uniref:malto-oligosyltrehalose synthase n=1 Tax=Sagittula sp. NFXS13 TaxID=2819095 RepID=UPI0032DFE35D